MLYFLFMKGVATVTGALLVPWGRDTLSWRPVPSQGCSSALASQGSLGEQMGPYVLGGPGDAGCCLFVSLIRGASAGLPGRLAGFPF